MYFKKTIKNKSVTIFCFLVVVFLFFINTNARSQSYEELIDQFNQKDLKTKLDASYELFKYFRTKNANSARYYAEVMYNSAAFLEDSLNLYKSLNAIGYTYKQEGQYSRSIPYYKESLEIATKLQHYIGMKSVTNNIGLSYLQLGYYDKSLEYFHRSLRIREKAQKPKDIGICSNNLGFVYAKISDHDNALYYYNQAVENFSISKDLNDEIKARTNSGQLLIEKGKINEAIRLSKETLEKCQNPSCNASTLSHLEMTLANAYLLKKEYSSAQSHIELCLEYTKGLNNQGSLSQVYLTIGKIAYYQGKSQKAFKNLNVALTIAKDSELREKKEEIYAFFSIIYKEKGDYKKSLEFKELQNIERDSMLNQQVIEKISKVQLQFQEEKNQEILDIKNAEIAKRDTEISKTKKINIYLFVAIFLFVGFCIILYWNTKIKNNTNKKLSRQQSIIEEQNIKLKNVNTYLEEKVKERTRALDYTNNALTEANASLDHFIYKTSHDIRGPLATLEGIINLALIDVADQEAISYFQKLQKTSENLNQIFNRLKMVNKINNATIFNSEINLYKLISEIIEDMHYLNTSSKVNFKININKEATIKSDPYLLYVIVNNLVGNAIKFHNESDRIKSFVQINGSCANTYFDLDFIDNGIGIETSQYDKIFKLFSRVSDRSNYGGVGLFLVKMATDKLKGKVKVGRTEEGHTLFKVSLPQK